MHSLALNLICGASASCAARAIELACWNLKQRRQLRSEGVLRKVNAWFLVLSLTWLNWFQLFVFCLAFLGQLLELCLPSFCFGRKLCFTLNEGCPASLIQNLDPRRVGGLSQANFSFM